MTIEDVYESGKTKNRDINETIHKVVRMIEESGDEVISDFDIYLDNLFRSCFLPHSAVCKNTAESDKE